MVLRRHKGEKLLVTERNEKVGGDMAQGEVTRELGEGLESLENHELKVFYDHGDSDNPHVCEPRLYFGSYFLAVADIVVLDRNKVKVICEIEERGASPKKILGDIVGILLANEIRIKENNTKKIPIKDAYYNKNPFFFILGVLETVDKVEKLKELKVRAQNIKNQIQDIIKPEWVKIEEPIYKSNSNIDEFRKEVKEKIIVKIGAGFDDER